MRGSSGRLAFTAVFAAMFAFASLAYAAGENHLFDAEGKAIQKDSDMYKALDVLARQVGILGIFSDWPATVTYYANCMGLK